MRTQGASRASALAALATLSVALLVRADEPPQVRLDAAISRAALLAGGQLEEVLELLSDVAETPLRTKLVHVHELQRRGVAAFLREQRGVALGPSTLAEWLRAATTFLAGYKESAGKVDGGGDPVALAPPSGLPLVRRTLMARFVAAWLTTLDRRLPEAEEPQLRLLVTQLYDIHRESVRARGVIEYFHISKCGGTSWNAAAVYNGCKVPHSTRAQHIIGFDDYPRWVHRPTMVAIVGRGTQSARYGFVKRRTNASDCAARFRYVASQSYSYYANEYTLFSSGPDQYGTHLCPQVVNVVTIREPLRRMESGVKFLMAKTKPYWLERDGKEHGEATFAATYCNSSAAFWEELAPPLTDNYQLRSFLGETGFHSPVGSIGQEQVAVARELLAQYDVVTDLDAGVTATDRIMYNTVGWPSTLANVHRLDITHMAAHVNFSWDTCHPNEQDWQRILARHAPDMALYRFGRVLSQLDALWLDILGAPDVPSQNMTRAQIRCGLLWRRGDGSALAQAMGIGVREKAMARRRPLLELPARVDEGHGGALPG